MKKIGLLLPVLLLSFISYSSVSACVCSIETSSNEKIFTKSVTSEFHKSSVIFSGKVISGEYVSFTKTDDKTGKEIKGETFIYRFSISSLWKGEAKNEIIINTEIYRFGDLTQETSCDFNFKIGEQFLIFATNLENKLLVNSCGKTALLKDAEKVIKILKKLHKKKN